jgi:hypothetical protein
MTTTRPIRPPASAPPTVGELLEETLPVIDTVYVAGPPVLLVWAGTVLLALMLAGPFALVVTFVVALAAAAALVTLAGAILATPYLLIRHFRRRLAERRHFSEGWASIATKRPGIAALAESMTARASR